MSEFENNASKARASGCAYFEYKSSVCYSWREIYDSIRKTRKFYD